MAERRKRKRNPADDYYAVLDRDSNGIVGGLANITTSGLMLITKKPVKAFSIHRYMVELPEPILECDQVAFDAECRWCQANRATGWYESGHELKNVSDEDMKIITHLTQRLMMHAMVEEEHHKGATAVDA